MEMFMYITILFGVYTTVLQSCLCEPCLQLRTSDPTLQTRLPPRSQICLDVPDIPADIRFFLIQVNSQKLNITLSYINSSSSLGNAVTGTGVGLVSLIDGPRTETFWLFNGNDENVTVVVGLVSYGDNDPIPGGCNMEFPIEISPFLRLYFNRVNTRLEFQHAQRGYPYGRPPPVCSEATNLMTYRIYLHFLPERDFTEETYFKAMAVMRNVSSIKAYGTEVNPYSVTPRTRAIFMSYPGQGVIFNVIAQTMVGDELYEAAYTPLATYGCSFDSSVDGCGRLTGAFGKALALVIAACGLFVAVRGHRHLTFEMAYFGFLTGALVTFVLLTKYAATSETDRDILTVTGGVLVAITWSLVWWWFGIPVVSVLLVGFVLGFLLTAVVYFTPLGAADIFRNDFNYWMILACGMLAVPVLLLATTRTLSILGSSIVGSYFVIVAVDRFIGSTLSYIVLNVIKRAVSEDTSVASNVFPFQKTDIILSSLWVFLSVSTTLLQSYLERNRAPFPPAPRKTWLVKWQQRRERRLARMASLEQDDEERSPLIGSISELRYDSTQRLSFSTR